MRDDLKDQSTTDLDGEWRLVSGINDGLPGPAIVIPLLKRVSIGTELTIYAGPAAILKARFTVDAEKSPKTIDYFHILGSSAGQTQLGIYEVEGDLLKVCTAAVASPRPTQFESVPGDGNTYTVWRRKRS